MTLLDGSLSGVGNFSSCKTVGLPCSPKVHFKEDTAYVEVRRTLHHRSLVGTGGAGLALKFLSWIISA